MAKDPAFLFYPSDFLTGTMFMTNEQIGIYIRLLCSQHQHGGLIDKDSFNALAGTNQLLRNKFIETDNGFYNERLTEEMEKRNKKSSNLSEAAKLIWSKRKQDKIQLYNKSKENLYNSNTIVQKNDTIVIQPEDRNINNNKGMVEIWFNDLLNSTHLIDISRNTGFTLEYIKLQIPNFKKYMDLDYPNHLKFINHFKNWLLKNKKESQPIKRKQL